MTRRSQFVTQDQYIQTCDCMEMDGQILSLSSSFQSQFYRPHFEYACKRKAITSVTRLAPTAVCSTMHCVCSWERSISSQPCRTQPTSALPTCKVYTSFGIERSGIWRGSMRVCSVRKPRGEPQYVRYNGSEPIRLPGDKQNTAGLLTTVKSSNYSSVGTTLFRKHGSKTKKLRIEPHQKWWLLLHNWLSAMVVNQATFKDSATPLICVLRLRCSDWNPNRNLNNVSKFTNPQSHGMIGEMIRLSLHGWPGVAMITSASHSSICIWHLISATGILGTLTWAVRSGIGHCRDDTKLCKVLLRRVRCSINVITSKPESLIWVSKPQF